MGANPRVKGRGGEYEVRDILQVEIDKIYKDYNDRVVLGLPKINVPVLKRNLEQTREGKFDLVGLDWIAVEVKRQENDAMMNQWWEQTKVSALGVNGEYVREPVLIWRKNNHPWKVRMFGFLIADDKPGGLRIRLPVDINLQGFLAYFRARVLVEIGAKWKPNLV